MKKYLVVDFFDEEYPMFLNTPESTVDGNPVVFSTDDLEEAQKFLEDEAQKGKIIRAPAYHKHEMIDFKQEAIEGIDYAIDALENPSGSIKEVIEDLNHTKEVIINNLF